MNTLIDAIVAQREADQIIGVIPCLNSGAGIEVIAANAVNKRIDNTIRAIATLNNQVQSINKYHPELVRVLNWDWEVELEHRLMSLDDASMLQMLEDILTKKERLTSVRGFVQMLGVDYPEHWINLTVKEVTDWVDVVYNLAWKEMA